MDQQNKPQMNIDQSMDELRTAKDRLTKHAEKLSLKEYMVKHPYITVGVAFLTGMLAGNSQDILEDVTRAVVSVVSKEIGKKE